MENKTFCSKPFTSIYNFPGKCYAPCCWANKFDYSPDDVLPLDHFSSSEMNRLRKEMLLGEKTEFLEHFCKWCWMKEEKYGSSPRLHSGLEKVDLSSFNDDGSFKNTKGRFLEVALNIFGNNCNLQCYECRPTNSSSRIALMKMLDPKWTLPKFGLTYEDKEYDSKKIDRSHFDQMIDQLIQSADKISSVVVVGGEPMLMKSHFDFLDKLINSGHSKYITLSYVSNMTMMTLRSMSKYFENFKYTHIQWSVDGLGERNSWLRYPTNWKNTLSNVKEIQNHFSVIPEGTIRSTITTSLLSITTFKETYEWLVDQKLAFPDDSHDNVIIEPNFLCPRHLPKELKKKVAPDIRKISEFRYNELMSEGDENMFKTAVEYCDELDKVRGTNWRLTFPEIAEYAT